jgi:hypothetical protein
MHQSTLMITVSGGASSVAQNMAAEWSEQAASRVGPAAARLPPPVPQRGGLPLGFGQKILVPILGQKLTTGDFNFLFFLQWMLSTNTNYSCRRT